MRTALLALGLLLALRAPAAALDSRGTVHGRRSRVFRCTGAAASPRRTQSGEAWPLRTASQDRLAGEAGHSESGSGSD